MKAVTSKQRQTFKYHETLIFADLKYSSNPKLDINFLDSLNIAK